MTITELIVCIVAGLGAGLGTGLAGLSAAAVVSPMLITFLHMPAYQAIGIALASDVLGIDFYTGRKLRFLPCAKRNNGRIFKRYDTACRTQIYSSPDHDNEGSAGKQIRGTENPAVHSLRRVNWLYLRFCRCRRRYDAASGAYKCAWL